MTENEYKLFIEQQDLNEGKILPSIALGLGLLTNIQANSAQKTILVNYKQPVKAMTDVGLNINEQYMVDVLAKTLFKEAAGEPFEGKHAVASVIWNRVYSDKALSTWKKMGLVGICKQPKQFSCWNDGEIKITLKNPRDEKAWKECVALAKAMVTEQFKPNVTSLYYYNPKVANPSWAKKLINVKHIGNHKFGEI